MKILNLYADGFRSGIIEVPSSLETCDDTSKRRYIKEVLIQHLPPRNWKYNCEYPRGGRNTNSIITSKYVKDN